MSHLRTRTVRSKSICYRHPALHVAWSEFDAQYRTSQSHSRLCVATQECVLCLYCDEGLAAPSGEELQKRNYKEQKPAVWLFCSTTCRLAKVKSAVAFSVSECLSRPSAETRRLSGHHAGACQPLTACAELLSYVQPAGGRSCCLFLTRSLARLRHEVA